MSESYCYTKQRESEDKSMKRAMKNTKFLMLMFLCVVAALWTQSVSAQAASKAPTVNYSKVDQFMLSPEWDTFGEFVVEDNLAKDAKVSVSVDNKKIATIEWDSKQNTAWVTAKKPGTVIAKLTIKQNGKTYTYKSEMTWAEYVNPLASLKIGKKSYDVSYFDGNTQAGMTKVSGKNAVQVKLQTCYQIVSLGFSRGGKYTGIKNGAKINFTKSGNDNTVLFINYMDPYGKVGVLRLFVSDKNETFY